MKVLTSIEAVFNGSHVDPDSGVLHGHDYRVVAGWTDASERFEALRERLRTELADLDHAPLPDGIWSAEDLARWLWPRLACDHLQISRPLLGHSVTVLP